MKKTIKSLFLSGISILLCLSMLAGSTFAWFTDEVKSGNNVIMAGNLDIEMHWTKDLENGTWIDAEDANAEPVFNYDKWEPGYSEVRYIKIKNAGNLAFKFALSIIPDGEVSALADVLDVYYVKNVTENIASRAALKDMTPSGTLRDAITGKIPVNGVILPNGETKEGASSGEMIVAIAIKMRESAGNEYKKQSIGTFSLKLTATQYDYESDSFDDKYDEGTKLPEMENFDVVIDVTVDGNGYVTDTTTVQGEGYSITVPAGAKTNGTGKLGATVTEKATTDSNVVLNANEVIRPLDVHVEGVAEDNTVPIVINLGKVMPVGLNIGNYTLYHVENGQDAVMTATSAVSELDVHNEFYYDPATGEVTVAMATFSEVALVAEPAKWEGNRDYSWYTNAVAPVDGEAVTEYTIANADQLAAFGAIVGGMAKDENGDFLITYKDSDDDEHHNDFFEGKTVKLVADINLGDKESENNPDLIFYPIGYWNSEGTYEKTGTAISSGFYAFKGTFDGNGNTISNFYQNTWEMKGDHDWYDATLQYYRDGMGLFGKILGGTVKNLTVENFSCDSEIGTSGVIAAYADSKAGQPAIFENIAIINCNPRVYNIGNGGIVGCAGWYSRNDALGTGTEEAPTYDNAVTFRNITVDQTNKISALWGSWGVSCAGILGQYYPNSNCGIKLENCHVAAIIDVNNDVCSNYQYYWYRYAGMFIGTIRANTKDSNGYTVADTTGVTATECTYTMGDWNEYWYCEIVANTIASYTHDHQFSRLDNIYDLSEISNDGGKTWEKEGHFALLDENRDIVDCYHIFKNSEGKLYRHFHDVADESNPNIYESFDLDGNGKLDDLKEDRQRYFIPFNQLLTGLDMGIKAHTEFDGIEFVEDGTVKSEEKFASLGTVTTYRPGQTITLGQLFNSKVDETKLSKATIYAAVSPATENDSVSATYSLNLSDWRNSTITFADDCKGSAKIVITDYFYCTPTVIYLSPEQAAEKFTANTVGEQNAYTQITLGTLFGVKDGATIGNVTATVTDPNGKETTVTGTSSDWATKTINLTKDGKWTVAIEDDDAYCSVTTVTFTVNKADKFTKKFDKDFLYRVGNENTVDVENIFGEFSTAVALSSVNVQIENIAGNATGIYTSNVTWTKGTIQFSGTGVVKVTISADGANPVEINLEVVDATNVTSAPSNTTNEYKNYVFVKDINTITYVNHWNCTIYGNGFTYSLNGAPTTYNSKQGHGIIITKNAILDNLVIVGDIYDEYGAFTENNDYNAAIDVVGETTIQNCYVSGCAAPIKVRQGDAFIKNTTLYGGAVANLIIVSCTATLEDVITANYDDGRSLVGMGIVIHSDATESAKLVLNGMLTQYNFINESKVPTDSFAQKLHEAMFSDDCSQYHFGDSPNRYVNTGIISLTSIFNADDIDGTVPGYSGSKVRVNAVDGYVYTQLNTSGSMNNNFPGYKPTTQGAVSPSYSFDYTNKNYVAKTDGSNDYCYAENGKVNISMDAGDAFNWDTSILTIGKEINSYQVSMNGVDYTGKNIAFNTAGDYKIVYTYTDDNNYELDVNGNITTYSVTYTKTVNITVAVIEATTKHAEFTFGSSNTASTTVTVGNSTYVMPNVNGTSSTIGSITVDNQTIYYPIVEIIMSDGKTSHTSGWYAYFPVFSGAVTITDYADGGKGDKMTPYNGSTTTMPSGLSIVGDPSNLFKYQSGSTAGESPVVKNNILVYSSAKIEAKRSEYNTFVKYSYTDNAGATYNYYIGYHAPAQSYTNICVTPDTLVTLADGTQKEIQYVTYEDELLVWDFYTGKYTTMPSSHLVNHGYADNTIIHLNFADGTIVKVVNKHAFFDVDINEFALISNENVADYVGHRFVKQDGTTTVLESYSIEEKYIEAYSILSVKHYNCYLEGMLSLTPPEASGNYFMPFEVGENMTFDAEKMQADIEKYGLFTYEEFSDRVSEEVFYALNAAQVKVAIGKGIITMEEFEAIVNALADKEFAN